MGGDQTKKRRGWLALYFVGRYCTSNEEKGVWDEEKGVCVGRVPPKGQILSGEGEERKGQRIKEGLWDFFLTPFSAIRSQKDACQPLILLGIGLETFLRIYCTDSPCLPAGIPCGKKAPGGRNVSHALLAYAAPHGPIV